MRYPRVLVVGLVRINAMDTSNEGLLFRNLFATWPRENLAQIYSSGGNGDDGFFGRYYQLGTQDRYLGWLFYKLKTEAQGTLAIDSKVLTLQKKNALKSNTYMSMARRVLLDTGFYELIFRPRISNEMRSCVMNFQPDIIIAEGYNLTFTWLPIMLASYFRLPIAYYPTDDWPSDAHRSDVKNMPLISKCVSRTVTASSRRLVDVSSVRVAFNRYMQEEYRKRYGKDFSVLMHGDNLSRFQSTQPKRLAAPDECWIVATGVFNHNRMPLLNDLDQACEMLSARGLRVRATVFAVNELSGMLTNSKGFRHIRFEPCPSHDGLASMLRGADILFLPERFDETAQGIRLSISSKAHLFMFSGKPIIVYSDPVTGIVRYATEDGWAAVVDRRDPGLLADTIERLFKDDVYRQQLIAGARSTAEKNHNLTTIRSSFFKLICSAIPNRK